jgi:integrase
MAAMHALIVAQFEATYPIGSRARLALGLLLFTGQRRSDVVRMGRQHVKGRVLKVTQQKTGTDLEITLLPELQEILAAHPADNMTFLTTKDGKPFTPGGFSHWFRLICREAGLPGLSAHGLRKAMCRRLAEAECSPNQIASISGHATLQEVARYTKAADQKRMAESAMDRIKNKTGVGSDKPSSKVSQFPSQVIENKG